ncbi:trigger factor [Natranaerobius thermophilus]|uniref:Trigger factor n=1 Tax=Natranaerobius thermophilus (strain ATCC BAA-1301 / DSM 18059 / JW/NM-WN-LF) TaxID=457570 RepID=TIG_NATTJ|nr:trigger factor [Natranaerobius thermophilus]B2A157.1 RecName: Full=Trigger factor; Short=TF; AltName: Full=PPIase [Natranaerobius thermophilus JW/NM-WN-LF]ACB84684.1 trigger factor [Natranaerobius thermophilus JW/NM-WN-LF]
MSSTWEKIDKNKIKLSVEVDENRVEDALEQAYKKVVKQVEIPGFRKGKVPRKILENRFGPEVLYEDAIEILVPEAYQEALEEHEIEPVDQPEIDIDQMEKGQPLKFNATVEVKPEVELGTYKGLEVEKEKVEVTEEDVENELKQMQEQHAEYEDVEDGEAENGDRLVIDFEGYVDGEPIEGGQAENHNIELGSNQFIPGFEEQLVGSKPGEEKEVKVTFPEDYQNEELKGKEATFNVKVKEIKKKNLLPIDDEFAKDVSDFDTLEEFKNDIRNRLEEEAERAAEQQVEEQVVTKALENAEVEIPQPMIDQEVDNMLKEFEQNLSYQGLNLDTYYKLANTDEDAMKEQFKGSAETRVKRNLVLEAIKDEEGITATEEEIDEEINKIAEQAQQEADKIKEFLEMQGRMSQLKNEIAIRKSVDLLKDEAKVTVVEKSNDSEEETQGNTE